VGGCRVIAMSVLYVPVAAPPHLPLPLFSPGPVLGSQILRNIVITSTSYCKRCGDIDLLYCGLMICLIIVGQENCPLLVLSTHRIG
jgi:hypothetical protein